MVRQRWRTGGSRKSEIRQRERGKVSESRAGHSFGNSVVTWAAVCKRPVDTRTHTHIVSVTEQLTQLWPPSSDSLHRPYYCCSLHCCLDDSCAHCISQLLFLSAALSLSLFHVTRLALFKCASIARYYFPLSTHTLTRTERFNVSFQTTQSLRKEHKLYVTARKHLVVSTFKNFCLCFFFCCVPQSSAVMLHRDPGLWHPAHCFPWPDIGSFLFYLFHFVLHFFALLCYKSFVLRSQVHFELSALLPTNWLRKRLF
mgnify:CR=1 FL=1